MTNKRKADIEPDATARSCKVLFTPDGTTVEVPPGTTLLAAATKAGVFVNSVCGGDGVCGRCRVIVRDGKVCGGSTEFFTRDEIRHGYILACQGHIASDVEVEIPPETRLAKPPERVEGEVPSLTDVSLLGRAGMQLTPLVTKTYLQLPKPSLDNNIADLQRLEQALRTATSFEKFQMGLKVTRRLPTLLRESQWQVTALSGHRGCLTEILDVEEGDTSRRNFAIAADVGTTTVVCHLVNLRNGQTLGCAAKYNSQASLGSDVIRRIIHASAKPENEAALREAIVGDLNELIDELTAKHHLGGTDVTLISAAGNTTMMHLLLGLPVENIRKEPYIGGAYRVPPLRAAEVGLKISPRGLLYCLPCVAGFVGADIVAGIHATGLSRSEKVRMLIDIGTNGEIVIGNKDFLICASASAGPAFEGAECRSGMRATRGAIDHIRLLDADRVLQYSTIGSEPPLGICGTGYVDLLSEMIRVGLVDKTGRLSVNATTERIRKSRSGESEYVVIHKQSAGNDSDIVITQGDVNNILRAKGAIFAAASVLLKAIDTTFDDLAEIMVAGAFGNFLNVEDAVFIGLLPDIDPKRMKFVGNTSIAGAKLAALSRECYEEIFQIADRTTYFELSTDPGFMDQFVSACFFPHTNIEMFPSVMAELGINKEQ